MSVDDDEGSARDNDDLFVECYDVLRRMARGKLRSSRRDAVLDTTALVHESFLRIRQRGKLPVDNEARFLAYASRAMRSIVVDHIRRRHSERGGGGAMQITLTTGLFKDQMAGEDEVLKVHDALQDLDRVDPRMAQVVEMRYFGGLTETEIGTALGVSDRTVRRDWDQARLFLADALS
jgi:RNA polymerase sigma factor (TIGR02999 family)